MHYPNSNPLEVAYKIMYPDRGHAVVVFAQLGINPLLVSYSSIMNWKNGLITVTSGTFQFDSSGEAREFIHLCESENCEPGNLGSMFVSKHLLGQYHYTRLT